MTSGEQKSSDDASPKQYALRLTPRARTDIESARSRFEELSGGDIADEWEEGIEEALRKLTSMPRRYPVAPEGRHFRAEVRQALYRRRPNGPAYRILFTAQDDSDDGPMVTILHVRHGARAPLTRGQARQIEGEDASGGVDNTP